MADFHWIRPHVLWLLLPALAIWWALWRHQDRSRALRQVIDPQLLEHLLVGQTEQRRVRPVHVLLGVWLLVILAWAGPSWQREPSPFADDSAGLVVVLKVSGTMEATDVQPSRLERAKHKLRDLLAARQGAATGLIVYSGSAHLVMPLTRDGRIITTMVADLTPQLMPVDGDALGDALRQAEDLLLQAQVPGSILVMADNVSPGQAQRLTEAIPKVPVQMLALQPQSAPADAGLDEAARALKTEPVILTVDDTDVERISRRAQSDFQAVMNASGGDRWQDAGYRLIPLIALATLLWSRKGWVVG